MKPIKMLLVYPEIQGSVTSAAIYSLPLGLGAVATFCRRIFDSALEAKILDGSMVTHSEQVAMLEQFQPSIVGFSPTIASMGNAYALAQMAHEAGATVVFGGVNSTNLWRQMLANRSFIDAVVLFEGEGAMAEIVHRLISGKCKTTLFAKIPNVAYRDSNGGIVGPERIRVFGLEEFPNIDYTIFDLQRYFQQTETHGFDRAVSYYAGKGCSKRSREPLQAMYEFGEYWRRVQAMNSCSFCGRDELGFRTLPPDRETSVLRDLYRQHGVRGFFNVQDTVSLNCDAPVGLDGCWFRLFIGVESITPKNIARLKHRYGPNLILQAGIETATPQMRCAMGKPALTEADVLAKAEMLAHENVQLHPSFIFGGRGETVETMRATARMARRLVDFPNVTWILISPQIILPGSPDYRRLLEISDEMRQKWGNADLIDFADISRDFLQYFAAGLSREMVLAEIKSVFADIRSQTSARQLVLDVKGVLANEETTINPKP